MEHSGVLVALALISVVGACAKAPSPNNDQPPTPYSPSSSNPSTANMPLVGTHWTVVEVSGKPLAPTDVANEPFLQLGADGRVAGSGGCNRLTGSYTQVSDSLHLGQMASTRMACDKGMDRESALLAALNTVDRYTISGSALVLWSGASPSVRLRASGS